MWCAAGCDSTPAEWCIAVGIISGCGCYAWSMLMQYLKIDDPVDAVAVHGCCGVLGVLCIGLFHKENGFILTGNIDLLISQLKGIASIISYVCGTAFVYFYVVHAFGVLRMNMVVEVRGIDYVEFKDGVQKDITHLQLWDLQMYYLFFIVYILCFHF